MIINSDQRTRHAGAVVIVILVLLTITAVYLGFWAKRITAQHHQIRSYHHAAQARWLAESGLRRAVARRAGNSEYLGELWIIPPGALSQHRGGRVEIQVEPAPNASDSLRITARADYPDDAIYRVRHTESIIVPRSAFSLIEFKKRQETGSGSHPTPLGLSVGARSPDRARPDRGSVSRSPVGARSPDRAPASGFYG